MPRRASAGAEAAPTTSPPNAATTKPAGLPVITQTASRPGLTAPTPIPTTTRRPSNHGERLPKKSYGYWVKAPRSDVVNIPMRFSWARSPWLVRMVGWGDVCPSYSIPFP